MLGTVDGERLARRVTLLLTLPPLSADGRAGAQSQDLIDAIQSGVAVGRRERFQNAGVAERMDRLKGPMAVVAVGDVWEDWFRDRALLARQWDAPAHRFKFGGETMSQSYKLDWDEV